MNRSIMAVGAHADDIEIWVGGTLLKYRALGYEVVYVQSTNNMSGKNSWLQSDGTVHSVNESPLDMMRRRKAECDDAARVLGSVPIHLDHPQRHYHSSPQSPMIELRYGCALPEGVAANVPSILTAHEDSASVARVTDLILDRDPEVVLTHGVAQHNVEHFTTGLLVTYAYWNAVKQGYRGALLHWREANTTLGGINCRWETFVDYSPYLDQKMELIGKHACQMPKAHLPEFGHRNLCREWGTACGCQAAEVFTWVRRADRDFQEGQGSMGGNLLFELNQNSR